MGAFDLNRFAPPETATFRLRNGQSYTVLADPDVGQVARMLRIENVIRGREEGDIGAALLEGKELVVELIRDVDGDADVSKLAIGIQEMLVVFTLLVHGESVAEAVLEAVSLPEASQPASGDETAFEPEGGGGNEEPGGVVAPLASARPSSSPSSSSESPDAGVLATGTA